MSNLRIPRPGEITRETDLRIACMADASWYDEVLADLERIEPPATEPERDGYISTREVITVGAIMFFLVGAVAFGSIKILDSNSGTTGIERVQKDRVYRVCQRTNADRKLFKSRLIATARLYSGARRHKIMMAASEIDYLDCQSVRTTYSWSRHSSWGALE